MEQGLFLHDKNLQPCKKAVECTGIYRLHVKKDRSLKIHWQRKKEMLLYGCGVQMQNNKEVTLQKR